MSSIGSLSKWRVFSHAPGVTQVPMLSVVSGTDVLIPGKKVS